MVMLSALWLPVVLSAVIVFVASSILHMVLPYHRTDYRKLPDEETMLAAMREKGVPPGDYAFPFPDNPKEMRSPEMMKKYAEGPVGMMTLLPNGPPAMGKSLTIWFVYCLVIGVCVAYLGGRTLGPGTHYLVVFRVVGTTAFLAYSGAVALDSIWKGVSWSTTFKHIFDGFIYALLTAGVFGWLWP
jgi:hypothetical protein